MGIARGERARFRSIDDIVRHRRDARCELGTRSERAKRSNRRHYFLRATFLKTTPGAAGTSRIPGGRGSVHGAAALFDGQSVFTFSIFSTTSMPATTLPNTA